MYIPPAIPRMLAKSSCGRVNLPNIFQQVLHCTNVVLKKLCSTSGKPLQMFTITLVITITAARTPAAARLRPVGAEVSSGASSRVSGSRRRRPRSQRRAATPRRYRREARASPRPGSGSGRQHSAQGPPGRA